jgi:4'-phosphopantetheinyl transferase
MCAESRACEVWRLPLTSGAVVEAPVWATLSPQEQAQADRFRHPEDRVAYAAVHALLRLRLGAWVGQPTEALHFVPNPFGKPALQGPGPQFNLSHCRSMVCIAVSAHGAVGVDVEPLDRGRELDLAALAPDVLTPAEQAQLGAGGWPVPWDFMRLWTLKEAVVKASGEGLSQDLHAFGIELHEGEPSLWRASGPSASSGPSRSWQRDTRVQLRQWWPDAHALALAHTGSEPVEVTHHALDLPELVRWATATSRQERPPC